MNSPRLLRWVGLVGGGVLVFGLFPSTKWGENAFATPVEIYRAIRGSAGEEIGLGFYATFLRFLAAGFTGSIVGVVIGTVRASAGSVRWLSDWWLDLARVIPAIVWIPVLLLLRAPSELIPYLLGSLYSSVYLSLEVELQLREVSEDERTFMAAQEEEWWPRFVLNYLSRIAAGLTIGGKIAFSIALILVVVGEALTGVTGLGELLTEYQASQARGALWGTIVTLGLLTLVTMELVQALGRLVGEEPEEWAKL